MRVPIINVHFPFINVHTAHPRCWSLLDALVVLCGIAVLLTDCILANLSISLSFHGLCSYSCVLLLMTKLLKTLLIGSDRVYANNQNLFAYSS